LVEEPRYEVLKRIDSVEIRKYPPMLLATAVDDSDLFGLLSDTSQALTMVVRKYQ
jgi:hypothetical protein